ncbi:chorismate synthase [Brumimicrobium aurantiacum]|uniref:Chorismate synthase n=1 Tax=Brumimicrobium aurantiacum TaxID=1737063 RepID=A0A3E1EZI2_9FLAO|nr:chorismate synthase [Brumimicrobium aurantiacum]RFC54982.1 chorismate synthase [Brumimicrobium aurantiacum]
MSGNSIGHTFKLTTYGESHGEAIGGVIDGVPSNFKIDLEAVQRELDRRKPGQSSIVTQRKESDTVRFLSGIFEGKTTGSPIGFIIENENQKSKDYSHLKDVYRPSHADFTYDKKYGHRDYRGGGRSSARETASRVVAGAIAKQFLAQKGIQINAFVSQVGKIKLQGDLTQIKLPETENIVRCPDSEVANQMIDYIKEIRKEGDTIGGVIFAKITGLEAGVGEPVFDKLHADLGKAMLSINAVKGFEYGSGFSGVEMKGSQHNDEFLTDGTTKSNFSGGIQGGISNGNPIYFNVAFKPVATIMQAQKSINTAMESVTVDGKGRHDPCVVPRAVPIVEAMAAITVLNHYLRNKMTQF